MPASVAGERVRVWQPSGLWEPPAALAFARELGILCALDPLGADPTNEHAHLWAELAGDDAYFVINGLARGRRTPPDRLEELAEITSRFQRAWAATGIWGGLYCLPIFESESVLRAYLPESVHKRLEFLKPFKHVLTHKDLHLSPVIAGFSATQDMPPKSLVVSEEQTHASWFAASAWPGLGLPAPIRKLLEGKAS